MAIYALVVHTGVRTWNSYRQRLLFCSCGVVLPSHSLIHNMCGLNLIVRSRLHWSLLRLTPIYPYVEISSFLCVSLILRCIDHGCIIPRNAGPKQSAGELLAIFL